MSEKMTIDDLFSDSGPFNEGEVVKTLQPLLTIQKGSNAIFFKDMKLSVEQRILSYGLAKKLLKAKGKIESELMTAVDLSKEMSIKKGTIDPVLKKLREKGFLLGKKEKEIPNQKINEIIKLLKTSIVGS